MVSAQATTTIARGPEEVFDFLSDGANNLLWRPGVLDIEHGAGSGVGEVWRQGVRGPGGRRIAADYEITRLERPTRLAFRTIAGPARPEGFYELEPAGDGTRLSFELSWKPRGLARLLSSPVQRTMNAEVRQVQQLKEVLESR